MLTKFKTSLALIGLLASFQSISASANPICSGLLIEQQLKAPTYTLTTEKRLSLARLFETKIAQYKNWGSKRLFAKLKQTASRSSMEVIEGILKARASEKLLTRDDLAHTVGYIDFLREVGIDPTNMTLELRIEGVAHRQKAYLLTDLQYSLIQKVGDQKFMWTHEEGWAKERFLENKSGIYLCGQFMGSSKFTTLGDFAPSATKEQVLQKLGLKGYPDFDKPGNFYVLSAVSKGLDIKPMVPVIYKWIGNDGHWELATNFGLNSIPGYTSGGMSEVVIHTFTVPAKDLSELSEKGVSIRTFPDIP